MATAKSTGQQVPILKEDAIRAKGKEVQHVNIMATKSYGYWEDEEKSPYKRLEKSAE
jgi:hypothetical protein